jgi:hypothetical protein
VDLLLRFSNSQLLEVSGDEMWSWNVVVTAQG